MARVGLHTVQKVRLDLGWPGFELWLCLLERITPLSESVFYVGDGNMKWSFEESVS